MIEFNTIVLLSRSRGDAPPKPLAEGQRFIELRAEDAERVSQTDRRFGRRGDMARILRRFQHGLRYFAIEEDEGLVGWFWVAHAVPRYLDELRWMIPLDNTQAWARDAFVSPERRGKRLIAALMDHACTVDSGPQQFLSDVDSYNYPSLRAHEKMGFSKVATVCSLSIGKRLLLRGRPPEGFPPPQALRPAQRLLWLSQEEYAWHRGMIA
ncbi:N-acetyltransferase family protein [Pseudoxanthomonas sp. UTMC 1351]|uniref:N-acetyltransferase family protein n=1 Tax=Pseudoxanthomonas sp. UTMC 1351 TaxID=2695853 RepID=UPI0034CD97A8